MAHKVTTELQTAEHKYIMSNIVIKNIKIHGPLASAHIYINMYDCSSSCSSNQRLPKKKKQKVSSEVCSDLEVLTTLSCGI